MDKETINTQQDGPLPSGPPDEFKMPSVEELLKALDNLQGLSEENKQELRESILARGNEDKMQDLIRQMPEAAQGLGSDMLILFLLLAVVVLIFVFFGYKLYSSLIERDRKREEKKRQKQQKKRK